MGFYNRLKNLILGIDPDNVDNELTNQEIMDVMVKRFEWEVKHRSVGNRMVYPMTFTIVMHNNDFQGRMVEFQMFMPEVVKEFYEIILKYKDKYKDYTNPANYWTFRFIPSISEDMELDGKGIHVEEGKLVIIASILDEKESDDVSKSVNVSMPVDKTGKVKKMNINLAAFGKFVGTGEPITVDWVNPENRDDGIENTPFASNIFDAVSPKPANVGGDKTPSSGLSDLGFIFKGIQKDDGTAKLAYKLSGELYTYEMKSDECWICGEGGDASKPDTFVVKSNDVKSPHLLIRKDAKEDKYYVAAFAPASIEQVQIPVSTPSKPVWIPLETNVNISMNTFVVRFMKKH